MKRLSALIAALGLLALAPAAHAALFVGWLAECTATTTTTCTELTGTGYARQPIILSTPAFGKAVNQNPYSFASTGTIAGRALYDAATGGNLAAVMPLAAAQVISQPGDRGDVGSLSLTVNALVGVPNGSFSQAAVASGAVIGPSQDGTNATAGSALTITRGELYKAGTITW